MMPGTDAGSGSAGQAQPASLHSGALSTEQNQRLFCIDRELRHIIATNPGCFVNAQLWIIAGLLSGIVTKVMLRLGIETGPIPMILTTLGWFILLIVDGYVERDTIYKLKAYLGESDAVDRILNGWDLLPDIYTYIDPQFRFMLGPRPQTDNQWTRRVTLHLNWYAQAPKRVRMIDLILKAHAHIHLLLVCTLMSITAILAVCLPHNGIAFYVILIAGGLALLLVLMMAHLPFVSLHAVILRAELHRHIFSLGAIPPPGASAPPAAPPSPQA